MQSIPQVISTLPGPFQQRELANVNEFVMKVAQLHGEFPWHQHEEEELFLCWDGTFRIDGQPVPVADEDDGRVTFCNRLYERETTLFDDEDATIRTYMATRQARSWPSDMMRFRRS